jgi:hypothetical protein
MGKIAISARASCMKKKPPNKSLEATGDAARFAS